MLQSLLRERSPSHEDETPWGGGQVIGDDQTHLSDAEIIALSAIVVAEACEVNAANMTRESLGHSMAYDGFQCKAWVKLEKEMKNRGVL